MPRVTMPVIADVRVGGTRYYVDNLELSFSAAANPVPTAEGSLVISDAALEYAELLHPGAAYQHLETDATTAAWQANLNLASNAFLYWGGGQEVAAEYDSVAAHLQITGAPLHIAQAVGIGIQPVSPLHVRENTANVDLTAGGMVEQAGAGDAVLHFKVPARIWNVGIDNSGSDSFRVSNSATGNVGASTRLVLNTNGTLGLGAANPASRLQVQFATNALAGLSNPANYHAMLENRANDTGEGVGLGFSIDAGTDDVGAALVFVRTGLESKGEFQVRVKTSAVTATPPALVVTFQDDLTTRLEGPLSVRAALAIGSGLYVPWITGDVLPTAYFGSNDVTNDQVAVAGISSIGAGVVGGSVSGEGVSGQSVSNDGVSGSSTSGTGGDFTSSTGDGLSVTLTGAGTAIATFIDGATPVLTIQDGGQADFAEYLRHLGDSNTYWQLTTDRARLYCGGVQMLDAWETTKDYLDLYGYVQVNTPANANAFMTIGMEIDQKGNDDECLSLRDSTDIAHGMTDRTETDTYLFVRKASGADGGALINGFTEATSALLLIGAGVTDDTTKSTSAEAYVDLRAYKKSGDGVGLAGADANLVVIKNYTTSRFIFDAEGTGHADVAWTTFSDGRLKQNIDPVKYGLDAVMALEPVQYERKESGRKMLGFLAEDVYGIIPEAARKPPNAKSFWGMDYNALVPVLVRAVQELKAEVEELKNAK